MTVEFALAYIPRRMQELEINNNYLLKYRHFVVQGQDDDLLTIDAFNQYFYLIKADEDLAVLSDFGIYDLTNKRINEQQYEHQGQITVQNYTDEVKHITFIQVIPKLY